MIFTMLQVQGESGVGGTLNRLTLILQPNIQLYPGTLLTVQGLSGLQTSGCSKCTMVSDSRFLSSATISNCNLRNIYSVI